jgi:hypothetical protein
MLNMNWKKNMCVYIYISNTLTSIEQLFLFRGQGHGNQWEELIYPGMKKAIICALLSTQDVIEYRKVGYLSLLSCQGVMVPFP